MRYISHYTNLCFQNLVRKKVENLKQQEISVKNNKTRTPWQFVNGILFMFMYTVIKKI